MRLVIAIGGLVVVVLVAVFAVGGDSSDNKESLVHELKGGLEARGAPQPLTDCMVRRLDASLDNKEVERLYGYRASPWTNPKIEKALAKSGIACTLRLEKTGKFSRSELLKAWKALREPHAETS